jgi:alcohol oxidase
MAAMVWGYIKSRETARRMSSYAGEVTSMHPHFAYDSKARAEDMDLATTKAYAGPNHLSAGIQHGTLYLLSFPIISLSWSTYGCRYANEWHHRAGSWSHPLAPGKQPSPTTLSSNRFESRSELEYSKEDIAHIEKWGKQSSIIPPSIPHSNTDIRLSSSTPRRNNLALSGHMQHGATRGKQHCASRRRRRRAAERAWR